MEGAPMELVTALTALHTGFGLAKVAFDSRDDAKLRSAMNDLSIKLTDALAKGLEVQTRALELQQENEKLRKQLVDLDAYVLAELRPGVFACAYKSSQGDPTPAHYVCQPCLDTGRKSILQTSTNGLQLLCKVDGGHSLRLGEPQIAPIPSRLNWNPI
jgi:hypothetical protein